MEAQSYVLPPYLLLLDLIFSLQVQVGWDIEQPGLVGDVPSPGRGLEPDDLSGPFQPKPLFDSMTV